MISWSNHQIMVTKEYSRKNLVILMRKGGVNKKKGEILTEKTNIIRTWVCLFLRLDCMQKQGT